MVSRTRTRRQRRVTRAQRAEELRATDIRAAQLRTADAYAKRGDASAARGVIGTIPKGTLLPAIEVNVCKVDDVTPPPVAPARGTRRRL